MILQPNDAIFIGSTRDNKVYLIGEVKTPGAVSWEGTLSLLESISLAGGFTQDAAPENVVVIKGGLVDPSLVLVDAEGIIQKGELESDVFLKSGDIIYVPESAMASAEEYLDFATKLLQPVLATESSIVLGRSVKDIFVGDPVSTGTSINLNP